LTTSENLANFLKYIDTVKFDYESHYRNVGEKDKAFNDYRHALELEGPLYRERARMATKLQASLIDRRKSKDAVEIMEPLYIFIENEENKRFVHKLQNVLGDMRRREEKMSKRVYHKRVQE